MSEAHTHLFRTVDGIAHCRFGGTQLRCSVHVQQDGTGLGTRCDLCRLAPVRPAFGAVTQQALLERPCVVAARTTLSHVRVKVLWALTQRLQHKGHQGEKCCTQGC